MRRSPLGAAVGRGRPAPERGTWLAIGRRAAAELRLRFGPDLTVHVVEDVHEALAVLGERGVAGLAADARRLGDRPRRALEPLGSPDRHVGREAHAISVAPLIPRRDR